MVKFRLLVVFVVSALFFSSCDNELKLLDEWKDIPVVYGVLSPNDTAHYIRVEKAFLDPEKSAFEVARIADSLYYPDEQIEVFVKNVATGQIYGLQRVEGNAEGYPRETGDFAEYPNYLYKFKLGQGETLTEGGLLQFILNRGPGKDTVFAQDEIVSEMKIRDPSGDGEILNLIPESRKQSVRWRSKDDAGVFKVTMIIKYKELNPESSIWEAKQIDWVLSNRLPNEEGDGGEIDYTGAQFLQTIGSRIDASVQRQRIFDRVEVKVEAGSPELYNYINILQTSTGITSAEVVPNYSNLSEGYGLFATRNELLVKDLFISGSTMDSLRNGRFTKDLNFQ